MVLYIFRDHKFKDRVGLLIGLWISESTFKLIRDLYETETDATEEDKSNGRRNQVTIDHEKSQNGVAEHLDFV